MEIVGDLSETPRFDTVATVSGFVCSFCFVFCIGYFFLYGKKKKRNEEKSQENFFLIVERLEYQFEVFVFDLVSYGEVLNFLKHSRDYQTQEWQALNRVHLKWPLCL